MTHRKLDERRLARLLEGFGRVRLLVVGDVFLDEYLWGSVERVSPEAPVPVVHVDRESVVLGGAGNVVRNVVALGGRCRFCTAVGDDADGRHVRDLLKELDVEPDGIVVDASRPTTRKTRVVARSQQIVRFDRETTEPLAAAVAGRLLARVDAALPGVDGAVLEDYGKGLLAPRFGRRLMRRLGEAGLFVAVDPKHELAPFRGASLIKPNRAEAEAMAGLRGRSLEDWQRIGERLRRKLGDGDLVVTRGGAGVLVFDGAGPVVEVPTVAHDVYDVQGAGDTSIATFALALRAGADLREAAVLANAAAGVVVQKSGTATASPAEVRDLLPDAIAAARRGAGRPRSGGGE